MIAANDTAAPTFPLGTTVESATWRAHRYSDSIRVTSLRGAGKVGKRCPEFTVMGAVEAVAPAVLWAVEEGASVETMRAMLADVTLAGLEFYESEKRGVDVPARPAIKVCVPGLRATFSETEASILFVPGNLRDDTSLATYKRADAAKAFAWAQANEARLPTMTLGQFRGEMAAIGARFS